MKVPIAIGGGDFHLDRAGTGAWRRRPEIHGDSWFGLVQIIDYCLKYDVPLLAAGDLIDMVCQDDSTIIQFIFRQLDRLKKAGKKAYVIQGQHEYLRTTPWWALHDTAVHVNRQYFLLKDIGVYGLDYHRSEHLVEAWASIPKGTDLLMAHQVWIDLMGEHLGGECRFADVPHAKLLLTGDFHQHKTVITTNADGKSMLVLSPGSTCMRSIDEVVNKSIFLIYDDLSVESLPLMTRQVIPFFVKNADQLDEVINKFDNIKTPTPGLPIDIAMPIVHVYYDPDVPDVYRRLNTAIENRFHLFLSARDLDIYQDAVPTIAPEVFDKIETDSSINDALAQLFKQQSPEYELASELLEACNRDVRPADVLTQAETKFFACITGPKLQDKT